MLNPTSFRDLVSGQRKGLAASCLRAGFRLVEFPYAWVMARRNRRYDRGRSPIHRVDVPVISVGNLTLGGTGKTPLVEWLARWFRSSEVRVSIVSRGYGAEQGECNDEALELELALPDVPHLQNPNRVEAAALAVEELETQLILLDDGFQHRRLSRDLDIVLLDATEPYGFGHVFPRGTLREPLAGLRRAHAIVLSRADMLETTQREAIRQRVATLAPDAAWCEVVHQPAFLLDAQGHESPLVSASRQGVAAFCGIGNPRGFRHTLDTLGYQVSAWREFPDHHTYTRDDVESLTAWAADATQILCTRKDLVKLGVTELGDVPLRAVAVQLKFLAGEESLQQLLRAALR
ncbi:MAG: tetraacyldisaccharide 4'-kinase [Planctomycetota bacterium]